MTELDVDADLRLHFTDAAGKSTTARVTGSGQQLRIDVEDPDVMLAAVDPADVGRVADLMAANGITARVVGPRGVAATIGAGASSRLGRIVTGSSAVSPVPVAAGLIALRARTRQAQAAAVGVALAIIAVIWWRRS